MSHYRVTYPYRDKELTKVVVAFSPEEAERVFKHSFRNIAPLSVELVTDAPQRQSAPARPQSRGPFQRRGTDQELTFMAGALRKFREQLAAKQPK